MKFENQIETSHPGTHPDGLRMLLSASAGIALIPFGCFSSSLGLLLMKSAAEEESDRPLVLSPRWLLGFVMLGIVATAVDVIVLGILPLSVVAPFAGLTIVFSLLLARTGWLCAKEMLSWADVKSIGLVLAGVTLVSAFGPRDEGGPPSLATLVVAMQNPRLAVFACAALGSAAARLQLMRGSQSGVWGPVMSAFAAAGCGTLSQLSLKLVSTSGASLPGSLPTLVLAIVGLAIVAPLHLRLLNLTLSSSAVALGVPLYQSLLICCTTAAGGVLFGEFDAMPAGLLATYAAGVATATAGLALLSRGAAAATAVATEDDDDDDGEEAAKEAAEGGYVRRTSPSTAATELMAAKLAAEDTDADSAALMGLPPLPPAAGLAPLGRARRDSRLSTLGFGLGYAVLEARDAQYHRAAAGASRDTGRSRAVSHQPVSMQHEADNACGRNRRGSM